MSEEGEQIFAGLYPDIVIKKKKKCLEDGKTYKDWSFQILEYQEFIHEKKCGEQ